MEEVFQQHYEIPQQTSESILKSILLLEEATNTWNETAPISRDDSTTVGLAIVPWWDL